MAQVAQMPPTCLDLRQGLLAGTDAIVPIANCKKNTQ